MFLLNHRVYPYVFSLVLVAASVCALWMYGLKPGIDFTGGTLLEVGCEQTCTLPKKETVYDILARHGFSDAVVQQTEKETLLLRFARSDDTQNNAILSDIRAATDGTLQILRSTFVGGSVSQQLVRNAIDAVIVAVVVILVYIAWAFRSAGTFVSPWKFGIGAVIALIHDIVITMGVFAVLGEWYDVTVGVPFVAALLTILGYSVNDTIVVYDRVRENTVRYGRTERDFSVIVSRAVRETLSRSLNTSLTVVVVLAAIMLFGGDQLFYFALSLLIGVIAGTYSSIFVATALLVTFARRTHKTS